MTSWFNWSKQEPAANQEPQILECEIEAIDESAAADPDRIIVGYEKGTENPYMMPKTQAMKLMTRHGQVLGGDENPYRLAGIPDARDYVQQHPQDDWTVTYRDRKVAEQEAVSFPVPVQESLPVSPPAKVAGPPSRRSDVEYADINAGAPPDDGIRYMDADALSKLEGHDCFGVRDGYEGDRENREQGQDVPVSKFSPDNSSPETRSKGVFRSFSKRMKGSFRRPATSEKRLVSEPRNSQDPDPRHPDHTTLHPDVKAVPLTEAQHKLLRSGQLKISAPTNFKAGAGNLGSVYKKATPIAKPAHDLAPGRRPSKRVGHTAKPSQPAKAKSSKSKKPPQKEGASPDPPPERARKVKVKVIGEADRMTLFGDFVAAAAADSTDTDSDKAATPGLPSDGDFSILDIKPLRPRRRPSATKKVDTSRYDWMPKNLPTPAKMTSQQDWRMDEQFPAVDDLFDQIDEQIAEADIPDYEKPAANSEAHRLNRVFDRPAPGTRGVDEEDDEPEIAVDTFIHDKHSSWVVTERPNAQTVRSDYRRLQREEHDTQRDSDQAADLMERLRRTSVQPNGEARSAP
ncbi:hypothetical protein LTR37_010099 [Vermiconidia calcicola]|uniref:Uncharacterized protein n=1 Tax=Vermiconidia calcicola TaxID=1690605 RepID=A0ACC3N5Q0_9PEZI|nr:hypothetical protein LTR37_010099 [Vermiconidia calcicola]